MIKILQSLPHGGAHLQQGEEAMAGIVLCVVKGEVEGGDHHSGAEDVAHLGVRGGVPKEMTPKPRPGK